MSKISKAKLVRTGSVSGVVRASVRYSTLRASTFLFWLFYCINYRRFEMNEATEKPKESSNDSLINAIEKINEYFGM